jgi:diguanylate cyclase (GGDEF)-like protein
MYIKNCIETNRISEAFEAKNNLKLLVTSNDKRFNYYIIQIFLEIANEQYDDAEKTVSLARQSLRDGDIQRKDTLDLLQYIAHSHYWNKDWQLADLKDEELFVIDICKRLNFKNLLARIYISGFENDKSLYETVEGLEERLENHNKGLKIAKEMGNDSLQLGAYYRSLRIASTFGYTDVVNYFYKEKCIPLTRANHNLREEATAYNGLGYNCCACEDFDNANAYFNKGLIIYYQFKDINFIMETLYNMTINAIMVEDYRSANSYVTTCLYAVENIRKDGRLGIFHITKLYGFKALCCYYLGNQYMTNTYLTYMKRMLDYILDSGEDVENYNFWYDELFMYFYVQGLTLKNGELYERAEESLQKALFYCEKAQANKFFTYARCQIELARIFMILGKKKKAVDSLKSAIEYATNQGLKKQRLKLLLSLREITGEDWITEADEEEFETTKLVWEKGSLETNLSGITIADIKERIKNIGIINRSKEEKERMEFLARWSKIMNKTVFSIDDMVDNALRTFCNNFQVDNALFIKINETKPSIMYKNMKTEVNAEQLKTIYEYVKKNPTEIAVSRMDKFFYDYDEIMSVFDITRISSFMMIPIIEKEEIMYIMIMYMEMRNTWGSNLNAFILNNDLLSLFTSSIRQLTDAIERERIHAELRSMNNKLRYVALIDNLTGLFNRQGLQYNLERKLHEKGAVTAILYVDLDNFKYYNDHFGHDVGDLILVSFANIIKNICEGDGFAVRYGGDEFLMILNLERKEEALEAASSIYDVLEKENSFQALVERSIGKKIEISNERKVSCSVGISFLDKYELRAFDIALKQADEALFYIKRTGKRRYDMWKPEMGM